MGESDARLVEIVRDFLLADRLIRELLGRFSAGTLRFDEVHQLVSDDESSVLFRLKERCHALFRRDRRVGDVRVPREALFDLAVGSLFHEAMKFRENLYQSAVYGPRVRSLKAEAGPGADELFREFDRILSLAESRLADACAETETLLARTREQFRGLLVAHRDNGIVTRYLIAHPALVEGVFPDGVDRLLADIYGTAVAGYERAARSWLETGHFPEARVGLSEARRRGADPSAMTRLTAYAESMESCVAGRYAAAVSGLGEWIDAPPAPDEGPFVAQAAAAMRRIAELRSGQAEGNAASALARRLEEWGRAAA